jgi:hypothetical protein
MKIYVIGSSGNWWESRIRVYQGGSGMTAPLTPYSGFGNTTNYTDPLGYGPGATCVYCSSGMEDFFLSSYNFTGGLYAFEEAGLVFSTATPVISSSTFEAYR